MVSWRVARSLDVLLAQLNTRFPQRSKASDGSIGDAAHASRQSDHNPDANGVVHARDYTHDPTRGLDIARLSDELAASRDPRIKYIIANRWILDSRPGNNPWRWMPYSGSNPHTAHLHLSVLPGLGDQSHAWQLPMLGNAQPPPAPEVPDMTPEQDAILRRIDNEIMGPWKDGRPSGWGTVNGSRTMVAMLVDLVNALYAPINSAVAGSDYTATPRQYWANADAHGYANGQMIVGLTAAFNELADAYATERDTDAEQIKAAFREALHEFPVTVDVTVSGGTPTNEVAEQRTALQEEGDQVG